MKYYSLILVFILPFILSACANKEPRSYQEIESQMFVRLASLKYRYSGPTPDGNKNKMQQEKRTDDESSDLTSEEKLRVAKADMEGFAVGAALGGAAGGAIGSICPGIGSVAGGLAGGAAVGAAYAAVWSKEEANAIRSERDEVVSLQDLYAIDNEHPINDYSDSYPWYNLSIKWANIGLLHNYVLSSIYNQDTAVFFNMTKAETIDEIFSTFFYPFEDGENDYYDLYNLAINNIYVEYDRRHSTNSTNEIDEVITFYFAEIVEIPEDSLFAYTEEFMAIVDQELEMIDSDRLLLINGCLSTFIYSRGLWNLNVPNRNCGKYIFFDVENDDWYYVETPEMQTLYSTQISRGDSILVFVPRIRNNILNTLFLFDYGHASQLSYVQGNNHIINVNGSYVMVLDEDYDIEIPCTPNVYIPSGEYVLQEFEDGYFIAIN